MGRKIFPWTEIEEIEYETDYRWDCIDTEITELPDVVSWCKEGLFNPMVARIGIDITDGIRLAGLTFAYASQANFVSNINNPEIDEATVKFASQANIVSNIISDADQNITQLFASQSDIEADMTSDKGMTRTFIRTNGTWSTSVYYDINHPNGDISFRSYTQGTTQCALPAGTQDGDLLIWINGYDGTAAPGVPAGFTSIDLFGQGASCWQRAAYKIAVAETGPYTSSFVYACQLLCITKSAGNWVAPNTAGLHSVTGVGSNNLTTLPVTPLNSQDLVIAAFSNDGGRPIFAEPAGDLITTSPLTRRMGYSVVDEIVGQMIICSTGA